jgi:hypothetical protein
LAKKNKINDVRFTELLKQKMELENNRPHDTESMRYWKHLMGKVLEELELYKSYKKNNKNL